MVKKLVGIRLPEDVLNQLEKVAESERRSVNQMGRIAISEWLQSLAFARKWRYIIITKDIFSRLIKYMDKSHIDSLSEVCAKLSFEMIRDVLNSPLTRSELKKVLDFLPSFLGDEGLRWFSEIEIGERNKKVYVKGVHYLGQDFSEFFTLVADYLMQNYFNYELIKEIISFTPNSLYLEFRPSK